MDTLWGPRAGPEMYDVRDQARESRVPSVAGTRKLVAPFFVTGTFFLSYMDISTQHRKILGL